MAIDSQGNLFISDSANNRIRKVTPGGVISTFAGNGTRGYSGDGGPATSAEIWFPQGVAVDAAGNVFINDASNLRIRKVSATGTITTVAGSGLLGYSGDGGPAISAKLWYPYAIAVDPQGSLLIADANNNCVRKVSTSGIITTVAGKGGVIGSTGDGGPATSAEFENPDGVAADTQGNIYISDAGAGLVYKVSTAGIINKLAGQTGGGYSGDGGPGANARFQSPQGLAVDAQGNVYVADYLGYAVRRLQPASESVLIGAVIDAASQSALPLTPGKIVTIYGAGLGPASLAINQPSGGVYSTQVGGTTVSFNGTAAPLLYASATQVAAIVPYEISGSSAQVTVSYASQTSAPIPVPVAAVSPSLFTTNQTGAGQLAAVNVANGSINDAAHPARIGDYVALFATGEGQTTPGASDGKLAAGTVLPQPSVKISATVGGLAADVQYAGAAPGEVAGLMQVNIRIPAGVQAGGYVPVTLIAGDAETVPGAVWIAVGN